MGVTTELNIAPPANLSVANAAPKPLAAAGGLVFLLLASVLNAYQKNHLDLAADNTLWVLGRGSFPVLLALLAGFVICAYHAFTAAPPPPAARAASPVLDPLLLLRAFACLMVLAGHGICFTFLAPDLVSRIQSGSPVWLATSAPEAGVWVFFTLSGYLIGKGFFTGRYTACRAHIRRYALNRLLRIIPLYWAALVVVCALFLPAIFEPRNLPAFCNMLLFNMNGHLPYMPIKALWSLATEIQFYAAAPLLFILMRRLGGRPVLAPAIAVAVIAGAILYRANLFAAGGYFGSDTHAFAPLYVNLDLFVIGMAASAFAAAGRRPPRHSLAIAAAAIAVLYVVDSYLRAYGLLLGHFAPTALYAVFGPTLSAMLAALAIFCLDTAQIPDLSPHATTFWRRLEFLGVLTYAAYICHEPIFIEVKDHISAPANIAISLAWCAAVSIAVFLTAAILYTAIERPLHRFHRG